MLFGGHWVPSCRRPKSARGCIRRRSSHCCKPPGKLLAVAARSAESMTGSGVLNVATQRSAAAHRRARRCPRGEQALQRSLRCPQRARRITAGVSYRSSNSSAPGSAPHHRGYVMNCEQRRYFGKISGNRCKQSRPGTPHSPAKPYVIGRRDSPPAPGRCRGHCRPRAYKLAWSRFHPWARAFGSNSSKVIPDYPIWSGCWWGTPLRSPPSSTFQPTRRRPDHPHNPRATYAGHLRSFPGIRWRS